LLDLVASRQKELADARAELESTRAELVSTSGRETCCETGFWVATAKVGHT